MINYHFACACGCGQISEPLGKNNYIKLRKSNKWYMKGCEPKEATIVTEFKNGVIVKQDDF